MTQLYALPYDLSAIGLYFETSEEYAVKSVALRNDYGESVEEFEIQFIDGDEMDCGLDDNKLCEITSCPQVKVIEMKMSQGAKPGKGGILPGAKVTDEIANIRGIEVGKDSISPNRHPEVGDISQLIDFTEHVRKISGKPVGFKTVIGGYGWLEHLCEEIHARGIESAPNFNTVDSGDGGTGAAPMPLMDSVGRRCCRTNA